MADETWVSTMPPICRTWVRRRPSSSSNWLERCWLSFMSCSPLAHAAGDVVFGALVVRLDEDFVGLAKLDHLAQIHIGSVVGHPCGLLHVVGDDQDGDALLQFMHQFLDSAGGDRVERRGRLVEKQQFGIGGQG